jgi:hypothetical protein
MPGLSSSFLLSEDSTSCTIDTARKLITLAYSGCRFDSFQVIASRSMSTRHIAHYREKTDMYAKQIKKDGKRGPRRVDSKNLYN